MKTKSFLLITVLMVSASCDDDFIFLIPTESANYRFEQSEADNRKKSVSIISVTSEKYQILSVADSHLGTSKNLEHFFEISKNENPAAVILNGDITQGATSNYNDLEKCLPTGNFPKLFLIAGNHDIYFKGWDDYFARFGSSTYYFEIKTPVATDLVICLDTSGGTLGSKQLNWFEKLLETKRKNYRNCIVFTHNNFFREWHNPSTNPFIEEIHVMIQLFTKYNVEVVVTGHDHKNASVFFGKTLYLTQDAMHDKAEQASYLNLTVDGSKIEYCFIKI